MPSNAMLSLLLAVGPAAVSAWSYPGQLGFALGAVMPSGACKTTNDYLDDFKALSANTNTSLVRGYDAGGCDYAANIIPACKQAGFKVILGIWPDADDTYNSGKSAVQAAVSTYGDKLSDYVYAITVGSETIYRGNFTAATLNPKINEIKDIVGDIPVGTADSWTSYQSGALNDVITNPKVDILLANGFAFWQGSTNENATQVFLDDIAQAQGIVQKLGPGKHFMVGETGWPTGGGDYEKAVPGTKEAETYFKNSVCTILAIGGDLFVFEAFDEPGKGTATGLDGTVLDETHWGVLDQNRNPKYSFSC
ncbi:MAG: glycoside hydrolase 3 protein [Thelocarpon superellum]|nr:MAG: glycoside hydrolase 3 protein [Thelocarpon superellum]